MCVCACMNNECFTSCAVPTLCPSLQVSSSAGSHSAAAQPVGGPLLAVRQGERKYFLSPPTWPVWTSEPKGWGKLVT